MEEIEKWYSEPDTSRDFPLSNHNMAFKERYKLTVLYFFQYPFLPTVPTSMAATGEAADTDQVPLASQMAQWTGGAGT